MYKDFDFIYVKQINKGNRIFKSMLSILFLFILRQATN